MQDQIAQTQANSVGYRAPSYGLFNTSLTPEYWFGIPRNVRADGLGMDVDRAINQRVDRENNTERWVAFNRVQGARMSAMEHLVPEQMFSTEEAPANGISAVKAIQLAAAEGQRIYTITQDNLNVALQQIELPLEIENEIRDAVGAGLEVTTHQEPVNFFGNQSVGYVLLDKNTGAGAYRIAGGENGALIAIFIGALLIFIAMFLITAPVALAAAPFLLGVIAVSGIVSFLSGLLIYLSKGGRFDVFIFSLARFLALAFLLIAFPVTGGVAALIAALLPLLLAIPGDTERRS